MMTDSMLGYQTRCVAIPPCRDPFINNFLVPVEHPADKPQRFWISTWNSVEGCTGALVDENGEFRLYHFRKPLRYGFYSAAVENLDTLWLWGNLNEVVRLSLGSGKYQCFATGAPEGLVFAGMAYDRRTGKLLAAANTYSGQGPTAVSFDTRKCQTACVYEHVALDAYLHGHFANGDGTFTIVTEIPGTSLLHWDPKAETINVKRLRDEFDLHHEMANGSYYRLVQDENGCVYFPRRGWYDPLKRRFIKKVPKPDKEMTWFAQHNNQIVGVSCADGDTVVGLWELDSGKVRELTRFTDTMFQNINLTAGGKLVCVSMYGEFTRRDLESGRLEISRLLPTAAIQHTDCLRLIDQERLLGTPFITQRFWEVNLTTGKGYDCGRAAPNAGEILQTWRIGGKIYLAEYAGGRLVEYDPQVHPHFPENPRVVANPPESNRPIAAAEDGRFLFYACSAPYGKLGASLTRYDTISGTWQSVTNPVGDQRIISLAYHRSGKKLVATTHYDADCCSCPPNSDKSYLVSFSAQELNVLDKIETPAGTSFMHILGPLPRGKWLCRLTGTFAETEAADLLLEISVTPLTIPSLDKAWPVPAGWAAIQPFGKRGQFAVHTGKNIELWDMSRKTPLETLSKKGQHRRLIVDRETLLLLGNKDIVVLSPNGDNKKSAKRRSRLKN